MGRVRSLNYQLILSDKTFRPVFNEPEIVDFVVWAMNSRYFRTQVELALSGAEGLANNLPLTALKRLWVAVPPADEAVEIAKFLEIELSDIDATIERVEGEIELLEELRDRLIADVVTGKLDVRDAAAALPGADPGDRDSGEPEPDTIDDFSALLDEVEA